MIDAAVVEGFVKAFLLHRYDDPKPIPQFHRDLWDLCCLPDRHVAIAAPRGFAKSTTVTHAYLLAKLLFRESRYALIVSDTESQAAQFLGELRNDFGTNDELIKTFGVRKVVRDSETDVIVRFDDGEECRIMAKGSEQKVRGLKWKGMRPDLIIGDDLENDEIVMNPDRREKFRNWVFKALMPAGSDKAIYRFVGTVLHFDSMLERLLNDKNWLSKRFQAHASYDDFSMLLWPERWDEERLRSVRAQYDAQGMPEGYSQEYLNVPMAEATSYFRKGDFLPMTDEDRGKRKVFYAVGDLAISKAERADSSVFGIVGVDDGGIVHVVETWKGKFDGVEITNLMFEIQKMYSPQLFGIEEEKIKKALGPFWNREMIARGVFLSFPDPPLIPSKDKRQRARAIQARMRAGGVRFDMDADWFPALQEEMLRFDRGAHDDYVDMMAWVGLLLDRLSDAQTDEEVEEELYTMQIEYQGRSALCGY